MKLIDKKDLSFSNGVVTMGDEVVSINSKVVSILNTMETAIQMRMHLNKQPKAAPMPSLEGFKRERIGKTWEFEDPETPELDAKVERAKKMCEEIDAMADIKKANKMLKQISPLMDFADSDKVMVSTDYDGQIIDTPFIGDPLKLTPEKIIELIDEFDLNEDVLV